MQSVPITTDVSSNIVLLEMDFSSYVRIRLRGDIAPRNPFPKNNSMIVYKKMYIYNIIFSPVPITTDVSSNIDQGEVCNII
jgi:hypothetical protein